MSTCTPPRAFRTPPQLTVELVLAGIQLACDTWRYAQRTRTHHKAFSNEGQIYDSTPFVEGQPLGSLTVTRRLFEDTPGHESLQRGPVKKYVHGCPAAFSANAVSPRASHRWQHASSASNRKVARGSPASALMVAICTGCWGGKRCATSPRADSWAVQNARKC